MILNFAFSLNIEQIPIKIKLNEKNIDKNDIVEFFCDDFNQQIEEIKKLRAKIKELTLINEKCSKCQNLQKEVEKLKRIIEEESKEDTKKLQNKIQQLINYNKNNNNIIDYNNDEEKNFENNISLNMFIIFKFFSLKLSIKLIYYMFIMDGCIEIFKLRQLLFLIIIDMLIIIFMLILDSILIDKKRKIIIIFLINILIFFQLKDKFINKYISFDIFDVLIFYVIRKLIKIWFLNNIHLNSSQIIKCSNIINLSELLTNIIFCIITNLFQRYNEIYSILFTIIFLSIPVLFYYYDSLQKYYKLGKLNHVNQLNDNNYDEYSFIKKTFTVILLYINNNIIYIYYAFI